MELSELRALQASYELNNIKDDKPIDSSVKKDNSISSMMIKKGDKMIIVALEEVAFFNSEDKYVFINDREGKKYITDNSLSSLEKQLPENFVRIQASYIINKDFVQEIRKGFKGRHLFIMNTPDKQSLPSSRVYVKDVKTIFEN